MFGLGQIVPAGHFSIGEHLADDVLKVGDQVAMRARAGAKEKPRRSGDMSAKTQTVRFAHPQGLGQKKGPDRSRGSPNSPRVCLGSLSSFLFANSLSQ